MLATSAVTKRKIILESFLDFRWATCAIMLKQKGFVSIGFLFKTMGCGTITHDQYC